MRRRRPARSSRRNWTPAWPRPGPEIAVVATAQESEFSFHYEAEPTIARFHQSDAFLRGIRGPFGSGKSVGCIADMVMKAIQQEPDKKKCRRTRWGAVRNTYAELRSTTIQTVLDWFGADVVRMNWQAPITGTIQLPLEDGTTLEMKIYFVSVDRPDHVKKLKSIDLTGGWLNEASELGKFVLDMLTGRVGRFPLKKDGAPLTWCGILMDTNSMDDDHWWHHLDRGSDDPEEQAEIDDLKAGLQKALAELGINRQLVEFFDQPPALIEAEGSYVPNPEAENVRNQQLGAAYWLQMAHGKAKDWIDVFILNKYGRVVDGKPVYTEYNDRIHGAPAKPRPISGMPITLGLDFGLSPALIPMQVSPKGKLLIFGECCALERSMGLTTFLRDAARPYLANHFGSMWSFKMKCDPAGNERAQSNEVTCFNILRDDNWDFEGAKTNAFQGRREAVASFLTKLVDGESGIVIDDSAKLLRKGFQKGYHYRRVQVSGEERYQDEPYKNKFSHPHDGLQYGALDFATIEAPGQGTNMIPNWQRRLSRTLGGHRPWRHRGGRV